ncbi:reverse transcriptase [Gossypium australe]|uniref:Reverse transcriptase n=1 Tax=Gossypium australe TaxID=47621 RepID=A0A5B6W9E0_9ROSI|nr:reverse transcriptase [Gossypium australe]
MRLKIGVREVEFGWDLSLRASTRRASITNSIWLRDDEDSRRLGRARGGHQGHFDSGHVKDCEQWGTINNVLGINLEGYKPNGIPHDYQEEEKFGQTEGKRLDYKSGQMMEWDSEDVPISNEEGNKRQRSDLLTFKVSNGQDSVEVDVDSSSPRIVRRLQHMLKFYHPQIVFFMETKLNASRMEKVRRRCGFFNGIDVAAGGSRGGTYFTWERGRTIERNIRERIDRGVATNSWLQNFPNYSLRHLPHSFSDHYPLFIETEIERRERRCDRFRFESCRMSYLANGLKVWGKKLQVKHKGEIHRLNRRIEELNGEDNSEESLAELIEVKLHLNMELDKEERYWEQRVRVNWLQMRDKNTSFFYKSASQRRINQIRGLQRSGESVATNEKEIEEIARRYFTDLFESRGVGDVTHILSGIKSCISESMNQKLIAPYTESEIIEALKGMGPTKAAGFDGFSAIFYKKIWHIVGRETNEFCLEALNNGNPLDEINKTLVVLHSFKNKRTGQKGFMALKLDMSKAYDRVEWLFIEGVMSKMGFTETFIHLIIRCLNSVRYTILINGEEGSSFRFTRGLRKGDPLSPYLFLFYGEGLSALMRLACEENRLRGVKVCRGSPTITHLMLADDCILFGEASNRGVEVFKDVLMEYETVERCKRSRGMGFRDLNYFNIALLAKQGWRLLRNLNSLLARTLEAKYCKNSDFIKSELGNLPSFTWKSLWAAKGLILQGMGWRIGDGKIVSIWNDKWLPGNETLNSQNTDMNTNLENVTDLFESNTRRWDNVLVHNTFTAIVAEKILSIPLSRNLHEDFIIWQGESTGEFSVRSGYRLLSQNGQTQLQDIDKNFYKRLWNLDLPAKIKITTWQSFCNYLPNYSNLYYRRLMGAVNCQRCNMEVETREHLFRDCPITKETWEKLDIAEPVPDESMGYNEWAGNFFENNLMNQCRKFVCALWGIWSFRNKLIHENETKTGTQIEEFVSNYLRELDGVKQPLPDRCAYTNRWEAPERTFWRINFDAAFNRQSRESCSGLVVRNERAEDSNLIYGMWKLKEM